MSYKAVFLDRDGVINEERGTYTFIPKDFKIIEGVPKAINILKENGFKIIVVTNQSGISQGLYSRKMMEQCHQKMQDACNHQIDDIYFARWHPSVSASLYRKPESLMLERAMAYYAIDPKVSWLIGDKERDIQSGTALQLRTILISKKEGPTEAEFIFRNLVEAVEKIISTNLDHPK